MQELNRRNTETAAKAIEELNNKVLSLNDQLVANQTALSSLMLRMNALEQQIAVIRVRTTSTGPST